MEPISHRSTLDPHTEQPPHRSRDGVANGYVSVDRSFPRSSPRTSLHAGTEGVPSVRFREDRHLDVDGVRTPRFSKIEYALLIALASLADTVADRRTLVSHVWGDDHDGVIRVVDVRVGRIRFKLDGLPRPLHLIDTVHGRGYRFVGRVAGALPVAPTGVLIHGWTIPRATSSATTSKRGD